MKVGWMIEDVQIVDIQFRKSDSQSTLLLDYIDKDKSNRDL